jgi:hypothetical protein
VRECTVDRTGTGNRTELYVRVANIGSNLKLRGIVKGETYRDRPTGSFSSTRQDIIVRFVL